MDTKKLNELKMGDEVTVITKGDYQLVDVANGVLYPPKTEVTVPLSGFVMDQLIVGNLTLAGEDDAPKAERDAIKSLDEARYIQGTQASRSAPTEDAFGPTNADYENMRNERDNGRTGGDEIPQGGRTGAEGTSQSNEENPDAAKSNQARRSRAKSDNE